MLNFENKTKLNVVNSDSDENTDELINSGRKQQPKQPVEKDCLDSSLSETENCSLLNTNYVDKDSDDELQLVQEGG